MQSVIPSRNLVRHLAKIVQEQQSNPSIRQSTRRICSSCYRRLPLKTAGPFQPIQSSSKTPIAPNRRYTSTSASPSASTTSEEVPTHPLDLSNHYTLFPKTLPSGPPPSSPFTISLPHLRREFLQLQALYHPDKFPQDQKVRAEALSSTINTAYMTLSDPLLRAQYLLLDFHEIDVLAEDQNPQRQDPETLMEVMEAQEAIEEAEGEEDIENLKEENNLRIESTIQALGDAFDTGDVENARKECIKLRFWRSLQDGLDSWEPGKEVRLIH